MQLQMNLKDNVRSLFPTPLARFILPNAPQINPGLSRLLLDQEIQAGADREPPLEGWFPDLDLGGSSHPDVLELLDSIRNAVLNMVGILARQKRFTAQQRLEARAVIYRSRSYCRSHADSESNWSGMYFVQAARLGPREPPGAGKVTFFDPRSRAGLVRQPGNSYRNLYETQPADGMMLLYPSWLETGINGFNSNSATLLVRFRSRVAQFQPGGQPT